MNLSISAQGFAMTPAIRAAGRERFALALGRIRDRVETVDVYLRDINGPRGGADKQVVARVRLYDRRVIAVESTRTDLYAAIARCAKRARRSLRRALARRRRVDRRSLRDLVPATGVTAGVP